MLILVYKQLHSASDHPDPGGGAVSPATRLSTMAETRCCFSEEVRRDRPGLYMVVSSLAMTIPSPSLTPSVFHDHRSVRGVVPEAV